MTACVVVPTLDEIDAVDHLAALARAVVDDEVAERFVVVDGGSRDGTVQALADLGVEVVAAADLHPGLPVVGKGDQIWRVLVHLAQDVVVFVDADVRPFTAPMVAALVAPLDDPAVVLAKGRFRRRNRHGAAFHGRITEYTARPALRLLRPELAAFPEPLSGQVAVRREAALAVPTWTGYGLEVGMLVSLADRHGVSAVRQVDLGDIDHRAHDDTFLQHMAEEVAAALLGVTGVVELQPSDDPEVFGHHGDLLVRPPRPHPPEETP